MVHINTLPPSKVQVGDYVLKAGIYTKPGIVSEKKEDGNVVVDTDEEQIARYHRHTNTSGLTPEEKDRFNEIMDSVMSFDSNGEKINQVQAQIDTLKTDPANRKVVETLRNEQAQLIRMTKELPRVYSYDERRLR